MIAVYDLSPGDAKLRRQPPRRPSSDSLFLCCFWRAPTPPDLQGSESDAQRRLPGSIAYG
jgi:hypothetical protein